MSDIRECVSISMDWSRKQWIIGWHLVIPSIILIPTNSLQLQSIHIYFQHGAAVKGGSKAEAHPRASLAPLRRGQLLSQRHPPFDKCLIKLLLLAEGGESGLR
ncbi:uncharacterized protein TRIREDRAFT_104533 [Trichoderma reesei QM6a]|uniref:Predicted protein n=2 Tax=Hypocrea jecorina TaxID=51453 RepID=G0RCN5_HYPJQ|nr:uncharacterized protein TRIREDRAFT_104533 [Trichoderma reesei QM6a]EGR51537.1 predicted protein [Trichoderma reesei QM6a]ETS04377.1 hypothetical protein M419DRAFT_127504 [Trichoderma reesei RUT C-30]